MKRLLSLTALLFLAVASFAHDFEVDGIYYVITSSSSDSPTVSVSYKGSYPDNYDNEYTGSVTIPQTVTYWGKTYSVTSIGGSAFHFCSGLTSITIPSSVTSIGVGRAFSGCTSLTSIKVDAGNSKYDSRDNCNAIVETSSNTLIAGCKTTTIPTSITSIDKDAFHGCSGLTSITIPESVINIGNYAFRDCTNLTSITIPNSVTSIGIGVFSYCTGLTSIQVDAENSKYDSRDNCNAIIETSSNELIAGCKTTTIPSSVTSIGSYAFGCCTGLTSITIPSSVTTIGSEAFEGCI